MSAEYNKTIAACVAAQQTERSRESAGIALAGSNWEARELAKVIAVFIGLALVLWLGIQVAAAAWPFFAAAL
jgi:hypothetical protein